MNAMNLKEPKPQPGAHEAQPGPMRLGRIAIVTLVVIVLAALAGILPRWRDRENLRKQTSELAVPFVIVTSAQPGKPSGALTLPAEVRASLEAPIYARASGYLKRWLVDIGASVKSGDLLAEIDAPELRQELEENKARLGQAQAALELAKITADRWADLLKTSSVSEQEAAEKKSDLALKSANLEAARASVRRLEELISFTRVLAPFAGTVTARKTDVGELVSATAGKELFRLAQTTTLRVFVRVPQTQVQQISIGQMAELIVPESGGRTHPAKIVRTSGAMDAQSRTLLVELEVDNRNGVILAGSFAQVRFPDSTSKANLTVPSNALLFRAEGPQVGVVRPDGTVELRSLKLGRDFGPSVEVLSGISLEDRIIVNPSDSLMEGAKVRISDESKGAAETPK